MNTPVSDPNGVDVRPYNAGAVTRLRYRGWILDVDHAGAITAPRQAVAGVAEDLAVCLGAAQTISETKKAAIRATKPTVPPQPVPERVETTPDRRPRLRPLIEVLHTARELAGHSWHPIRNDIYACTKQAWVEHEMKVPFAWLQRALREALPPNTTLTAYNDRADDDAVLSLFDQAIGNLTAIHGGPPMVVRTAS